VNEKPIRVNPAGMTQIYGGRDLSSGRVFSVVKSTCGMHYCGRLIPDAPIFGRLAGMTEGGHSGSSGIFVSTLTLFMITSPVAPNPAQSSVKGRVLVNTNCSLITIRE